jgi:hypothetical protein
MTILEQLKKWSEKTGGKYETISTINLSTDKLTVSACGESLEHAYEKIKALYGDFNEVLKEEKANEETVNVDTNVINSIPSITPSPNLSTMDLNNASTKSLAEALGNRKIVKIYTPGTKLEPEETTITYQNTQYVVK